MDDFGVRPWRDGLDDEIEAERDYVSAGSGEQRAPLARPRTDNAAHLRDSAEVLTARTTLDALRSELTEGDPSDVWPQHEVYNHIFAPLAVHLERLCDVIEASDE